MRGIMRQQRGDTLVEVMLAMAVLATVVVLINGIMNQGLISLQTSVERSQVRSSMQGQIDALRLMRDEYMAKTGSDEDKQWKKLLDHYTPSGSPASYSDEATCELTVAGSLPFYVEPTSIEVLDYDSSLEPDGIATPGRWMWIESYKIDSATTEAPDRLDLAVHACWYPLGGGVMQHETTIVRLYDGAS